MSPRPRKASDEQVFVAATRVMTRLGPAQITLAEIAAEAGLTAGALVHRFGSKRALLLTLAEHFAGGTSEMFLAIGAGVTSPLATLYAYGQCIAEMARTPDALAHNLAWLQQDLTDPDFRRFTLKQARASRRELHKLVEAAVKAGELVKSVDPAALARAIEVTVGGSLMAWAIHQEGTAPSWIKHDLDALLMPLTVRGKRPRLSRKSAAHK